jgi:hypothetical protein
LDKRSVEKASFYFLEEHGFNKKLAEERTLLVPEVRKSQSLSLSLSENITKFLWLEKSPSFSRKITKFFSLLE